MRHGFWWGLARLRSPSGDASDHGRRSSSCFSCSSAWPCGTAPTTSQASPSRRGLRCSSSREESAGAVGEVEFARGFFSAPRVSSGEIRTLPGRCRSNDSGSRLRRGPTARSALPTDPHARPRGGLAIHALGQKGRRRSLGRPRRRPAPRALRTRCRHLRLRSRQGPSSASSPATASLGVPGTRRLAIHFRLLQEQPCVLGLSVYAGLAPLPTRAR